MIKIDHISTNDRLDNVRTKLDGLSNVNKSCEKVNELSSIDKTSTTSCFAQICSSEFSANIDNQNFKIMSSDSENDNIWKLPY